jgi:TolB protein
MTRYRLLIVAFCLTTGVLGLAQTPPQPPSTVQQPPAAQPPAQTDTIRAVLTGTPDSPPRLAVPEFIPVGTDPETVRAAKTIGAVLFDDIAYEREFYMLPKDILRTVPQPASAEQVSVARWKELGADGVIVGTVQRTGDGFVVEARLIQVSSGKLLFGKQYSGSLKSIGDGGRIYAHTFADEMHQHHGIRGVARTKLAFSSDRDGARMKGPVGERDISNIYQADYDGANQTRITATRSLDIAPVWAPDRSAIAYTSYRSGFPDIIVQSLREVRVPLRPAGGTDRIHNFLPAWSIDGTRIAFTSNRDGNSEIYVMNRDGSGHRRITNHPSIDVTPTWSPTGTQLAFTSERTGSPQIYVVNADGTDPRRISTESYCDRPTWSPAPFNEIAYTCRAGGGYQIMVFDFAARASRAITDGIGSNESPAFAPNGKHLAFVSDRTGRQQVYTIDRDGNNLRQITRDGSNRYPNWSQ